MHPDAGAVIGISLAGSVLLVALIFLCLLNLPCCKDTLKPRGGSGRPSRNVGRPSTSSQATILSLPFPGSSRRLQALSALELHSQNQSNCITGSTTGLANPLWQLQCNSCGMFVTASQHSLNHHHHCTNSVSPCHCCHHRDEDLTQNIVNSSAHSPNAYVNTSSNFQYGSPQLFPPTDSPPPPYPVLNGEPESGSGSVAITGEHADSNLQSVQLSSPPPYSFPKYSERV